MDDKQKEWQRKFYENSGGTREIFRFGCAIIIWLTIGIGLYLWSNNAGYVLIFTGILFTFIFLSTNWQPVYSLLRIIFGNEDLPRKVMPYKNTWWSYILLIFYLVVSIAIVLKGIQLLIK